MTRLKFLPACRATLILIVISISATEILGAQTERVIHSFQSIDKKDGYLPLSGIVADSIGVLYGVTVYGGENNHGTVYKMTPPSTTGGKWKEQVIHSFAGGIADGQEARGTLLLDAKAKKILGTAQSGGTNNYGVVFQLAPPTAPATYWTSEVLYSFRGGVGGYAPGAGVISDSQGALYGTSAGGLGYGIIFRLSPPVQSGGAWTERVLYAFTGGADGAYPNASLTFDSSGAIFGTTAGGANAACYAGCGTVFKLSPPSTQGGDWQETTLYTFTGGSDGGQPASNVILDNSGALYGTTQSFGDLVCTDTHVYPCGTVFKLSPPSDQAGSWTQETLYSFLGGDDGGNPTAGLAVDGSGAFYGTTLYGGDIPCGDGIGAGCGTVFKLVPPASQGSAWTHIVLHAFQNGIDGNKPWTPV
jgi:uncharacterized repeat protein (TIGR03803 family)